MNLLAAALLAALSAAPAAAAHLPAAVAMERPAFQPWLELLPPQDRQDVEDVLREGRRAADRLPYRRRQIAAYNIGEGLRRMRHPEFLEKQSRELEDAWNEARYQGKVPDARNSELKEKSDRALQAAVASSIRQLQAALDVLEDKFGPPVQQLLREHGSRRQPKAEYRPAFEALERAARGEDVFGGPLTPRLAKGLTDGWGVRLAKPLLPVADPQHPTQWTRPRDLTILERVYSPAEGENTKWQHVPLKAIAYPLQKVVYDVPNLVTSTAVESVTRSPGDNAAAAARTFAGAGKGALDGVWNIVKGVANPTNASAFDGALQIGDAGLSVVKGAVGVAKTGLSVIAYPVFRLFGGTPSRSTGLPGDGKRATVIIVDTEGVRQGGLHGQLAESFGNTWGDQMMRSRFAQVTDYYCVVGPHHSEKYDCLANMPDDIENVDFFHLGHGDGRYKLEAMAEAMKERGKKPGLLVSVGCYATASSIVDPDDTVGQKGLTFAGHWYLPSLIEKRLRGIPMPQAAQQAYDEGYVSNYGNPLNLPTVLPFGYDGGQPVPAKGAKP